MATGDTLLDDRTRIEASIKAFRAGAIAKNAVNLFGALGYRSERAEDLEPNTAEGLLELVNRPDFFNRAKARPEEWASIDLLFQLTDEEVRGYGQTSLDFDSRRLDMDSNRRFESYLFFAVQLKKDSYSRTALADITREINRFFDMPALVLFRHGRTLTLSVINRRLHKRDAGRDVLEKVTLIKDIRVENPHRAHVEILLALALPQLVAEHRVTNFVELHDAWRKTLDISELNKRFYRDLANWYFWAREQVKFPAQPGVTDEANRATNVIRLITRLTFVWFLKERGLVPDDLFRRETLEAALTDMSPKSSSFYKAILQNLFFATLNTPMSDAANPREFRTDTEGKRHNDQYMVHNQYRHKKLFRNPEAALGMFASVPFLNGGLFECLDKREEVNGKVVEVRVDGFSDVERNQPAVPNRLFFCDEHSCAEDGVDLNAVYGTSNKPYRVRGLIDTLNSYKFTIAENTPIDEEVALDPELLGKVFENLLASYNPETGATARKQTGSFYTPREIVNYMVDESLIAYLETRLAPAGESDQPKSTIMREGDAQASFIGQQPLVVAEAAAKSAEESGGESLNSRLRQLFAYTDEPHGFTEGEVEKLIRAIDEVKILDPACGSGAYPMGILGKLVFILSKLDPQNARWKQRQIDRVGEAMRAAEKIEDDKFREGTLQDLRAQVGSIEEAFRNNELDYGRKLFLIENCIYGVDIQPIAIQISKLRFFVSLVIDQRIRAQAENLGIRPLPNLETKFVAANTLLGIEKPAQSMLQNEELRQAIEEKERELKIVRERHFTARTTRIKEKHRKEDERLRLEIGGLLEEDNWSPETTAKLIKWNPYDQNSSADFFDPEWMFGVPDGFDVVIGNPPYVLLQDVNRDPILYKHFKENFTVASFKVDLYHLFIEQGVRLLQDGGCISYITPSNFASNNYTIALRRLLLTETRLRKLIFFEEDVFEASVNNLVLVAQKKSPANTEVSFYKGIQGDSGLRVELQISVRQAELVNDKCLLIPSSSAEASSLVAKMKQRGKILGSIASVNFGMQLRDRKEFPNDVVVNSSGGSGLTKFHRPCYTGKDIKKYVVHFNDRYCYFNREAKRGGCWDEEVHTAKNKILIKQIGAYPEAGLDTKGYAVLNTAFMVISTQKNIRSQYLLGLLNSSCVKFFWLNQFRDDRKAFPKIKGEYLKLIPVPPATSEQQDSCGTLISQILIARRKDPDADIDEIERELDQLFYQLYGLTPDEIETVEASARA